MKKIEELLAESRLKALLEQEDARMKTKCICKKILIIVGAIAAVCGIAFAIYHFFIKDDFDDFDEDMYFDDEDLEDLLEDEEEAVADEVKEALAEE